MSIFIDLHSMLQTPSSSLEKSKKTLASHIFTKQQLNSSFVIIFYVIFFSYVAFCDEDICESFD